MKITLEPNGPFPPAANVAANIRAALVTARIVAGPTIPTLYAGTSMTVWFDTTHGILKVYSGVTEITFNPRNCVVAASPPSAPTQGMQWFNSTDAKIYTRFGSVWVSQ